MEVPAAKITHIQDNEVFAILKKNIMLDEALKLSPRNWILKKALESGELNSNKTILEASSGNTGISLAYLTIIWSKSHTCCSCLNGY